MKSTVIFRDFTGNIFQSFTIPLHSWIIDCVQAEGYKPGEILISFYSDEFVHELNLEFLNHNTLTDIITFDYSVEKFISGEIYISVDRVRENAINFDQDFPFELKRIIIHGILHLVGYNDKTPEQKMQMSAKEDYYLSLLPI